MSKEKKDSKTKLGRPRTTTDSLPNGWATIMTDMAKEGATHVQMRVRLGIGNSGWYTLKEDSDIFCETLKNCDDLAEDFWETQARQAALGINPDANATMMIFLMKNKFKKYSDKKEVDDSPNEKVAINIIAPERKTE